MNINLKKTQIELLKTLINLNKINPNLDSINRKEYITIIESIINKLKKINDENIAINPNFLKGLDPIVKLISGLSTEPVDSNLERKIKIKKIIKLKSPDFVNPNLDLIKETNKLDLQQPNFVIDDIKTSVEKISEKPLDYSSWNNMSDNFSQATIRPLERLPTSSIPSIDTRIINPRNYSEILQHKIDNIGVFVKNEPDESIKARYNELKLKFNKNNESYGIIKSATDDLLLPITNSQNKINLYKDRIIKPIDEITYNNTIRYMIPVSLTTLPDLSDVPDKNDIITNEDGTINDDGDIQLGGYDLPYKSFIPEQIKILERKIILQERRNNKLIMDFNILYRRFTYYQLFVINKAKQLSSREHEIYAFLTYEKFIEYYKKLEYCNYFLDNPNLTNETIKIWYFKHYFIIKILFNIFNTLKDIITKDKYIDLFIDDFKELSILFNLYYYKLDDLVIPA